jgi:hypothetical protein
MTPTIKRRIAREWLIFVAAIAFGLLVTYSVFYLGRNTTWSYYRSSPDIPAAEQPWLINEKPAIDPMWNAHTLLDTFSKPKNPGDMLNDMWPVAAYQYQYYDASYGGHKRVHQLEHPILRWDYGALTLWFYILSPYLAFCFLRSIIWSVNTLRRQQ